MNDTKLNNAIEAPKPAEAPFPTAGGKCEPRWPALMAFLTAWWLPATTARRTQHVSLIKAYGVHLLAAVLACILGLWLAAWVDNRSFSSFLREIWREFHREYERHPVEIVALTIGAVLMVEAGFLILALLLGPWGAADEPLRASIANALRHTWLHTVDTLPGFLVLGLIAVSLAHARSDWFKNWRQERTRLQAQLPVMPKAPDPPKTYSGPGGPDAKEWEEYYRRQAAWQKESREFLAQMNAYHRAVNGLDELNRRPFPVRYTEEIIGFASAAAGAWVLWAMLRAIGAKRHVPPITRPPTCEACGYNLTTMPMEARCPECGEPVLNSLGPANRPGAAWEHRRDRGRLRTWWRCSVDAALRPTWFGRQLRVSPRIVDHRRFLVAHFVPLFIICYSIVPFVDHIAGSQPASVRYDLCTVGPGFGIGGAAGSLILALMCAGSIGLLLGKAYRRNLIPAAMQVAAYLTGYLAFCTLTSVALGILVYYASWQRWFFEMEKAWRLPWGAFSFLIWLVPSLAMALTYLVLLYKGTQGARYANQ